MLKKLKLLTEQEEGYGVICEWTHGCSGLISNELQDKTLLKEFEDKLDKKNNSIFMNCILQKCDTENRNGRYYPRDILLREDKRYQQLINEGRAFGDSNHPDCYSSDSEILTKDGWKPFSAITQNEVVLTLNPETNLIEEQQITNYISQYYSGMMYHFKSTFVDMMVTPDHNFLVEDRYDKRMFKTATEIYNGNFEKYKFLKSGKWIKNSDTEFILKGIDPKDLYYKEVWRCEEQSKDIKIKADIWYSFLGLYLAEGYCTGIKSKNIKGYSVVITQKKPENIQPIRELMSQLPFIINEHLYSDGKVDFIIRDKRLHTYLYQLGDSYSKYIPTEIKNASPELLSNLLKWFLFGDGRIRGRKYKTTEVFSTSKQLIDDLHEILLKSGGSGNIKVEDRRNIESPIKELDKDGNERIRIIKNKKIMYFLTFSKMKNFYLNAKSLKKEAILYNGNIYCVSVPNKVIYVRRNGKAMWCGNCSYISLKKEELSHRVVKTWWERNTLMGVLEILTSKGYHESGIISCQGDFIANLLEKGSKLGISSRGVGSLKNLYGKNTVQSDFELICYDLVASPSTPGAFLYPQSEVNLNESTETSADIKIITNPIINTLKNFLQ